MIGASVGLIRVGAAVAVGELRAGLDVVNSRVPVTGELEVRTGELEVRTGARRELSLLPRSEDELVRTLGFTCFAERRELCSTGRLNPDPRREEELRRGEDRGAVVLDWPAEPPRRDEEPSTELLFGEEYFSRRGFLIGILLLYHHCPKMKTI